MNVFIFSCLHSPKNNTNLTVREEARKAVVSPRAEPPASCPVESTMEDAARTQGWAGRGQNVSSHNRVWRAKDSPVPHLSTMPSSPRVTLLHHTAVPESLLKAWKTWSSGQHPAQQSRATPSHQHPHGPNPGGAPTRTAHALQGSSVYLLCLTPHALHQLKISLEFTSAYCTACNCLCNAVVSLVLKPHFQYWMSTGTWIFPITVSHPAHFP